MRTIPQNINAKREELCINRINTALISNCAWLQYAYNIVQTGIDDNGLKFPAIYLGDGAKQTERLIPDNKIKAFCFYETGQSTYRDSKVINSPEKYNLSIIVWANMQLIAPQTISGIKSQLKSDIILQLQKLSCYNLTNNDSDNIWNGYDLIKEQPNQFLIFPYCSFKISFSIDFNENCKVFSGLGTGSPSAISGSSATIQSIVVANELAKDALIFGSQFRENDYCIVLKDNNGQKSSWRYLKQSNVLQWVKLASWSEPKNI